MLQGWTRDVTVAFLPAEKEAASFSGMVTCGLIFPARDREQQTSRICFLFAGKLFNHNEGYLLEEMRYIKLRNSKH